MDESWCDPDYATWLPTEQQREQSQQRLRFQAVPVTAEPIIEVVESFRAMLTNGGAHVASFDVVESDEVAAWFIRRNRAEYGLADRLVHSAAFVEAMPEVAEPGFTGATEFERSTSLVLDGELASSLQWGGAYTDPPMPGAQAKRLGSAFCASLFGDRYDDIAVDRSSARWSLWFKGVAWDSTWVVTDRRYRHLTVLCLTDVD
jgi:hypothetical protein